MSDRIPSDSTFQIGASTGRAIATWIVTLPKTVVLAVVALSPMFLWTALSGGYSAADDANRPAFYELVDQLLQALFGSVLSGMVIHVAFKRLMRESGSIGVAIGIGFNRALPLIGAGLVQGAIILLPLAIPIAIVFFADDMGSAGAAAAGFFGLIAVIVAAVATAMFAATAGAIVIESKAPIAALGRSLELTRGFRFKIFVCSILVGIVTAIVAAVTGFVGAIAVGGSPVTIGIVAAAIATPLTSTLSAVVYHDLRLTKEGVDVKDLMKVFA
jgi:hypothetical protein